MSSKLSSGHFRLLYFASAATFTRKDSDDFRAPLPVKDLFSLLEDTYPGMLKAVLMSAAVTINLEYVDIDDSKRKLTSSQSSNTTIQEGDEVAIIPPVSSG